MLSWLCLACVFIYSEGAPNSCNHLACSLDSPCELSNEACCLGKCIPKEDLPQLDVGMRCADDSLCYGVCAPGLECSPSGNCQIATALGCHCDTDEECISGLCGRGKACLASALPIGALCYQHEQCQTASCRQGVCAGRTVGDTCERGQCAADLHCDHGHCKTAASVGHECSPGHPCGSRLSCNTNVCVARYSVKVGDRCDADDACVLSAFCDRNTKTCKRRWHARVGKACDATDECYPGSVCDPHSRTCESTDGEVCLPGSDACNGDCLCDPHVKAFVCKGGDRIFPPAVPACAAEVHAIYYNYPGYVPYLFDPLALPRPAAPGIRELRAIDAMVEAVCCLAHEKPSVQDDFLSADSRAAAMVAYNCSTKSLLPLTSECRSDLRMNDLLMLGPPPEQHRFHWLAVSLAVGAPAVLVGLVGLGFSRLSSGSREEQKLRGRRGDSTYGSHRSARRTTYERM